MKKMNLVLAACFYLVSLNAQLTAVKNPHIPDYTAELKVTKMERPDRQVSCITLGETVSQITLLKNKKKITLSVLNVNPQMRFAIEDKLGNELVFDVLKKNSIKSYNIADLPEGQYSLTVVGSGLEAKRYFNVTGSQILFQDNLGYVTQIYE